MESGIQDNPIIGDIITYLGVDLRVVGPRRRLARVVGVAVRRRR